MADRRVALIAAAVPLLLVSLTGVTASVAGIRPNATGRAVDIQDFQFVPRNITILVGTTVTWTNHDADAHTITSDDGSWDSYAGGDPTTQGESWSYTFPAPGVYTSTRIHADSIHGCTGE